MNDEWMRDAAPSRLESMPRRGESADGHVVGYLTSKAAAATFCFRCR